MKWFSNNLTVVFALFLLGACKSDKEFLKERPETFYTIDNAFSSSAQVDQVLISIYSNIREAWTNPAEQAWMFVFKGNGTDMFDIASIRRGATFNNYGNINPDNGIFYSVYSFWYDMISKANLAIYATDLPQVQWSSDQDKKYALAQARFFRAFAYRNLGELFGGVPIVTAITQTPVFNFKRSTRGETYNFAISELEAILNDLPVTTAVGGRIVKGAAQHNLAELYLAKGTQLDADGNSSGAKEAYGKSIQYANDVIDGGTYSLMTARYGTRAGEASISFPVYKGGTFSAAAIVDTLQQATNVYWDLFQEGNVNYQNGNKECIWAVQIDYAAYRAEDGESKLGYSRAYSPVFRDGVKDHLTGTLEDVGGRGIADIIPTFYARDQVFDAKWGADMRNSDAVFRRRFKGNVATSPYFKKDVPWSVIYNGGADNTTNMNNSSLCYPVSCKVATDKYAGLADGENRSNLFRDEYVIRLSETILLRAEAKQRNGDKAGAAADINLLRARAQCGYQVTAADMDDHFDLILDERARELLYEECRWNTLLRMGKTIAVDRIRKYAYWPEAKATLTFNYNLWPIPQKVIETNKDAVIEQNPDWINK
ncbi:RagB/SusD family nutrient uptake outer membrane protein [Niabella drilacis]|uniref:Starch-binding associating with outer membrane n=1 Tax=Niabella drilacis (strain DSM 25811 / CCM 8410 / CCUG 62505 / LMG 26954 / E90) TaxID=1285928 RepID=A0A1G6NL89_NIADE|nr:RagB/SusD family nutrient uptake outer membrane protein [Niabella drilacis]SDC68489.1 Starch-binding associating with outer membrane [Niabella drilacis]